MKTVKIPDRISYQIDERVARFNQETDMTTNKQEYITAMLMQVIGGSNKSIYEILKMMKQENENVQ